MSEHDPKLEAGTEPAGNGATTGDVFNIPDNIMVRVSTWRPATDPPSTVHIDYIKSYLQSLKPKTRHILTGL